MMDSLSNGSAAGGPGPLLEVRNLVKHFGVSTGFLTQRKTGAVQAVDGISFTIGRGETLGLVGESGCGKSTAGRAIIQLHKPTSGEVWFDGKELTALPEGRMRAMRRHMQMVFQDPFASFDPLSPVASSVAEPLRSVEDPPTAAERRARLLELVELVRLRPDHLDRYPPELSGGQLQRLGIARALATNPNVVVLDEPVSSLDVSTQAQILNLLADLQQELGISYLLIAHNPALVRHASHRIAVMYLGEVVEVGAADAVYEQPRHPYTEALLSAVLVPDPTVQRGRERVRLHGEISTTNAAAPPPGCRFHPRCPHVMDICRSTPPEPFATPDGVVVRCHLHQHGPQLEGTPVSLLTGSGASPNGRSRQGA